MKSRFWIGTLMFGTLICAPALGAPETDFKAIMQKDLDAWSTFNADNAAPFYAKDADNVYFDVAPLKYTGWAEYAEGVKKQFPNVASIKFTLNDDAKTHSAGKFAWGTATVHTVLTDKNSAEQAFDARWTLVMEKRGKDWLIVHEHVSVPLPETPSPEGQSLYKRLGGYDALAAVTDDFIGRLAKDAQIGKYFAGHSTDSLKRIRQLVVDQLCEATGGPCIYIGRTMKAAHAGMGISDSDWDVAAGHLVETLNQFKVPPKEKDEVLAAISSLKKDIVASSAAGGQ